MLLNSNTSVELSWNICVASSGSCEPTDEGRGLGVALLVQGEVFCLWWGACQAATHKVIFTQQPRPGEQPSQFLLESVG